MLKLLVDGELAFFDQAATPEFWGRNWERLLGTGLSVSIRAGTPGTLLRMIEKHAPAGGLCVEAGCGVSNVVRDLGRRGYRCLGVDFSTRTLTAVRQEEPLMLLAAADVRRLPLEAESVDVYISQGVIGHFRDGFEPIVAEMDRILRPGGVAFVSFPAMSWLRRRKAARRRYETLDTGAEPAAPFNQYALDPDRTVAKIERHGFRLLDRSFYEGVLGLEDEAEGLIRAWMKRVYGNRTSRLVSGLRRFLEVLVAGWAGYCVQLAFRKAGTSDDRPSTTSASGIEVAESARDGARVSVVIPTFGREGVLVETVSAVLALDPPPGELIVVDQTPEHLPETAARLRAWSAAGAIRLIQLAEPSIPRAMNQGLLRATRPVVLFLDDDLVPDRDLIAGHLAAHRGARVGAVVGMVLQPGEEPIDPPASRRAAAGLVQDLDFRFNSTQPAVVANCMAGNLSVSRVAALGVGGFDEAFRGTAHRFETEFVRRLRRSGWTVAFEPTARIRHLRAESGGTRRKGSHLKSARPDYGVGDYYFALREGTAREALLFFPRRLFREVRTRFHLSRPWWIPVKLVGEIRAMFWAIRLYAGGAKLLEPAVRRVRGRAA
ncbi:methyltransferase domain-containing protein [Acidobacteria bacterium ACD]|nr:MAG: methyltransferase domain-containing protein [Acidobacteriota bacterium]MCE7956332.1 methyltransferase domain-containing protein [Acidobacteria bacterium ACB2]MDL1949116.1 methyltransferase domain-containing protein [Acidobacteria bacterium ACD]